MTIPPALLLVGEGTRDEDGAEPFRAFVRELAERNPEFPVAGGFVQLSQPSLAETVAGLVAEGTTSFAAVPVTLVAPGPGHAGHSGHSGDGIPAALSREEARHPDTSYMCGPELGPHPSLLSVLERRLEEALSSGASTARADADAGATHATGRVPRTPDDRAGVTVLLVGGGSTDPYANAEVHRAARLLWEGRGYAGVEAAFVSLAAPDVASGLDRCRTLGAKRVVVLPYFLFEGAVCERLRQQSAGWAAANPGVEVRTADVIGGGEELAALVLERYREAVDSGAARQPHVHGDGDGHARAR